MTSMTHALVVPLLAGLGAPELLIIAAVLVLLFGASKLPELARGSGRALRIFKAETKGLLDDDDDTKTPEQRQIDAQNRAAAERRPEDGTPGSTL
jgi:sec-independent protein translocase protein TatA